MANVKSNIRIGDILKELGYINDEQIKAAAEYQKEHEGMRFGAALIDMKVITEEQMLTALARGFKYDVVNIAELHVDPKALELVPKAIAEKYCMFAYKLEETSLSILVNDPLDFYGIEKIKQVAGRELKISLCKKKEIEETINYYYAELSAKKAASKAARNNDVMKVDIEDTDSDEPIINLLQSVIVRGFNSNASDIHFEPSETETNLRMRIDGSLADFMVISKNIHNSLMARIKILSDLDIAKKRVPQDGHMKANVDGVPLNIRVSMIPTIYGEKAVLRLMYSNNSRIDNESTFGMTKENFEIMQKCLKAPNGVIYFTGPTGSGKTTTLYMILKQLSEKNVNISTIEDPVEQSLARVNQMQVNQAAGLTFENGLRALLRQDPDIIMVGETRDNETAQISVRASLTGHLVFSTLHTNDAVSTIVRLEDMGIADYLIASSLSAVIAQRLVKKVCPDCAVEVEMTEAEERIVGKKLPKIKKACGCNRCNHTGYVGRRAIHEILQIDPKIRQMISENKSTVAIEEYAKNTLGMKALKESALELLSEGVTTMEEFEKIAFYI